jgi:hypothetical protein
MYLALLPHPFLRRSHHDMLMGLFTVQLCWGYVAYAQRSATSFALYDEIRLGYSPSSVTLFNGPRLWDQPRILVASSESPQVQECSLDDSSHLTISGRWQTPFPVAQLGTVDFDGNRKPELVLLSSDGLKLGLMRMGSRKHEVVATLLKQRCARFTSADIDNDGHQEILLFGKTMTGVATIHLRGGILQEDQLLFPDVSVSDLAVLDVNGDGVADVVLCQWLSNRLLVRFGISSGVFSEQATLDLPAEPDRMSVTTVSRRRMMRVLVTLPEIRGVAHVFGFPTGELAVHDLISLPKEPTGVKFSLVNDDYLPDMVCSTRGGYVVALGSAAYSFGRQTVFGAGSEAVSWTLGDASGAGLTDLVYVEKPDRLAVLSNARTVPTKLRTYRFATGVEPADVYLGDCNGDGAPDILTTNHGSGGLSLFLNLLDGTFDGQRCIDVDFPPAQLHPSVPFFTPRKTVVVVHPEHNALSVVQLPSAGTAARAVTVPTGPDPEVILADAGKGADPLRIFVHYRESGRGDSPIGLVEQLSSNRFVERSFRWLQPAKVCAVTAWENASTGRTDLLVALRDRRARATTCVTLPALEEPDTRRAEPLFSIPDSMGLPQYLVAGKVDGDGYDDLVVILGPPTYALGLARTVPDDGMIPPAEWHYGVRPGDQHNVVIVDADRDNAADIVYLDDKEGAVKVFYGNGRGEFGPPVTLVSGGTASSFAVGPAYSSDANDLLTTNSRQHTVTIYRKAFHR